MENIVKKIKEKKELSDLSDELVRDSLNQYIKKNNIKKIPENQKELKLLIKSIRAELRKYAGMFQIKPSNKKRMLFLEKGEINKFLKTHSSTKERLQDYPKIIEIINKENPSSILDLGCGLNPIAILSMIGKPKRINYKAYDIKEDELKLLDLFFQKNKINGKTFLADIRTVKNFPGADLCLIFKVLDIIETKGHKKAHEIIKKINCPKILASFSTRTLSGKPMNSPRRFWFENILKSLNLGFEIFFIKNEVFYLIDKPHIIVKDI